MSARGPALIAFVGDVMLDRDDPHSAFREISEEMHSVDLLFGNQEGSYTAEPHFAPSAGAPVYSAPSNAAGLGPAGFSVMSLANNHAVDCGHAAMLETADRLTAQGIAVCGAGADLDHARQAAYVKAGDYDVAVLSYASVFSHGFEARNGWPGVAPMRSHDLFLHAYPYAYQRFPGETPIVKASLYEDDVANLIEDLTAARSKSDFVVASFHWGDYSRKFVVTDHERKVARVAIDAGADIVVGHHHHALRGIEWYQGKPIFYGLGNFILDLPGVVEGMKAQGAAQAITEDDDTTYAVIAERAGWPMLPIHKDMRMTMMAWCKLEEGKSTTIGFLPCMMQPDGSVKAVDPSSEGGQTVIQYVRDACASENFAVRIEPDEDVRIGRFSTVKVVADA
ncbi:MAG TPA: CapA family protein [Candidatus Acidoferrum sp.]|nr:CapA family protein [Candidatus Acidoferrum sp.]